MASGLIHRYSAVSGKPLLEVEKSWRTIKQEFSANGRKKDWNGCIKKLRERLGLKNEQGRLAYLGGKAEAHILSETPDWACIKVDDLDLVENAELCYALFSANGVAVVPFSLLSHKKGGAMLVEMVDTSNLGAGTSIGVQPPGGSTATPAPTTKPASVPGAPGQQDALQGIVNYRGRKAVIITRDNVKAHIRYLDQQGGEEDVTTSELQPDKTSMESIKDIWTSIDNTLSENAKRRIFEAILMLEYSISYLPESLREDVESLPKSFSDIGREDDEENKRDDYEFDDSDWQLIAKVKGDDEEQEKAAADENPMPEPPDEAEGEREGGPAEKGIPPASDEEVHGMLRHMKAARESMENGARGEWSDRPKINISEIRKEMEKADKTGPIQEAKSVVEKNLETAHQWDRFFEERENE